jgi:MFS family permease
MRLPDALTPLRDRRFTWYFTGRLVSLVGTTMVPVALAFAVLEIDDSPSALGKVLAAQSLSMVLFLLVGGVVADRFSRSTVMQTSHMLSSLTQAAIAALVLTGTAQIWTVACLAAANGAALAFTFPAMSGLVPQVVPRTHLQQANALLSFTRAGLAVLGPTTAALLVVSVGPGWALAVDAMTWMLAAACMSRVRVPRRVRTAEAPSSMLRELHEGWSSFVGHNWLWPVVIAAAACNAIIVGAWYTLGPTLAKDTIGEIGWGYALSAQAVGVLLATVLMLRTRFRRPLRVGMVGVSLFAAPILVLGLDPGLLPLVLAAFVAGAGMELFGIGWQTALHEHIDESILSRVSSYDALGSFAAMPVGQLSFGALGAVFGLQSVLVVAAVVYAVCALSTLLSTGVRNLGRADQHESVPTETS